MKTTALGESQVKGEEGTNNNDDGGLPLLANGSHAASPESAKLANRGSRVSDKVALVSAIEKIESVQYGAPDFKDAKELRAAFHEADEEVKTKARTAIDSQADVILALAKVQAILSQRGKEKMRRDAGIKLTWTSYYQWFQKEFKFELTLRAVQYKITELAGKNRNRKCTECGKTGSHATSCSKYKEPTLPHLTQLEAKLLDTASRAHGIVKAVKQGGNLDEAIAEFESNAPTEEKLVEYAERPVKPSLGDVAAQPNEQSSNVRVADEPLNAEDAKLIKPAPQFPVIRQGNESKLFTFLSEGRVDRKSMLDSVFGGIDEGSFLQHVRKFSQRICDKFHDGVYEVSVYSKNDRVVIDKAAYDKLVAEVAALPKAAKVKTVKPVATDETPTTSPLEPDAEVISTTKVGDKSESTRHGFYWEFVKDEKPYAVRDLNNPNLGILHKLKSKAEADKYMNDREREAAACEDQSTARTAEKAIGVSNTYCEDSSMVERPVQLGDGGLIPTSSLHFVRIEKALATELVIKHHYLHRKPLVSWAFGIIRDSQLVGVCTFGKPMWSVQVGVTGGALWDVRKNKGRWRDVFELNRLWIADDVTDHCIESKFVAWCLRELKKENPNLILISYADGSVTNSVTQKNHVGVVYQAGGWIYTGLSSPWVDITIEGKDHRSVPKKMQGDKIRNRRTWAGVSAVRKTRSRKHRYVKFLNPKDEGLLAWKREPRPRKVM